MAVTDVSGREEIIDDAPVVIDVITTATPASTATSAWKRIRGEAYKRIFEPWKTLSSGDISGSLGDLGTFLPLTVALVTTIGLDLGTTLIFSGLYNIYSGAAFGVPIPVQPMKSIAAVAITEDGITLRQTLLAGFLVSTVVFTLGATKLIDAANRVVHECVIRGVQVGIGLKLAIKGADLVMFRHAGGPWRPWLGAQGLLLGLAAAVYVLLAVVKFTPGRTVATSCCDAGVAPDPNREDGAVSSHACVPPQRSSTPTPSSVLSTDTAPISGRGFGETSCHHACDAALPQPQVERASAAASADGEPQPPAGAACAHATTAASCGVLGDHPPSAQHSGKAATGGSGREFEASVRGDMGRSGDAGSWSAGGTSGRRADQHAHPCTVRRVGRAARAAVRAASAFPPALLVVLVGIAVTLVDTPQVLDSLSFGPSTPTILQPAASDWWPAFSRAALPQLPLTILNSVIAVTLLSRELFPAVPLSMPHVAASVGVMNFIGPWFGCMPCCHGAGGLAAQARFGARSGAAPMLLGAVKLAAGALAGGSMLPLLRAFPEPLLGVLLVFSGAELATTAAKLPVDKRYWLLMMITAATVMAKDTGVGFVVGLVSTWLVQDWRLHWPKRWTRSRAPAAAAAAAAAQE